MVPRINLESGIKELTDKIIRYFKSPLREDDVGEVVRTRPCCEEFRVSIVNNGFFGPWDGAFTRAF